MTGRLFSSALLDATLTLFRLHDSLDVLVKTKAGLLRRLNNVPNRKEPKDSHPYFLVENCRFTVAVLCDVMEDENLAYRKKQIEYQIGQMQRIQLTRGKLSLEGELALHMLEVDFMQLKELYKLRGADNVKNVYDLQELGVKLMQLEEFEEREKLRRNWRNRYGAPAPMCMHRPYDE